MLTNSTVTLFRPESSGGDFKKLGEYAAWTQRKQRIRNTSDGIYFCDNFDVRIPLGLISLVEVGDLICFGSLAEEEFRPEKCRKVAVASENTFGSNPHWHLEAEVQYR